jgi:hypothetical protein
MPEKGIRRRPYRVIADHIDLPSKVLRFKAGEVLSFERRPTEWEGWLFCTDRQGATGWVPENWLALEGDMCKARKDYDSSELEVRKGEVIHVDLVESGWALATNVSGEKGWVPLKCIEAISPDDTP